MTTKIELNIGHDIGSKKDKLTRAEIHAAVLNKFRNRRIMRAAHIEAHVVIPAEQAPDGETTSAIIVESPKSAAASYEAIATLATLLGQKAIACKINGVGHLVYGRAMDDESAKFYGPEGTAGFNPERWITPVKPGKSDKFWAVL
jgi:hypothetical protein